MPSQKISRQALPCMNFAATTWTQGFAKKCLTPRNQVGARRAHALPSHLENVAAHALGCSLHRVAVRFRSICAELFKGILCLPCDWEFPPACVHGGQNSGKPSCRVELRALGGTSKDTEGQGARRRSLMAFTVPDPASERKRGNQARESYNLRPCQTLLYKYSYMA